MEDAPSSERSAAVGRDGNLELARCGIRMDGEW